MYKAAILTISDKGYVGERADGSGQEIRAILESKGYTVAHYTILPDERELIARELKRLCDEETAQLVLTTGGTGFSKRVQPPEANMDTVERLCPGIPEAMRAMHMQKTKRALMTHSAADDRAQL